MKETAYIITGGYLSKKILEQQMKRYPHPLVIVVDGALETTHALGIEPDYIVGDFDTVNTELLRYYPSNKIKRHLPEKDQTDTELAIETALREGCIELVIYGATGSRLDHSLANIFLLESLLQKEKEAVILDENNKLYLKKEGFKIKKQEQYGAYVSLLPLTERVENVTLKGFKYSLEGQTFFRERTLGVSNEITEEEATVEFEKGIFLVVESRDKSVE